MILLVATTNAGKLREIRDLLASAPVDLISLRDIPPIEEPEETGETFEENARLKARYYAAHSRLLTVAEDSGLVVDALDGEPGVRSARFLGPDATYPQRFDEIYRRLALRPDAPRTARFVCALALARDSDILFETTAAVEGVVAERPRGSGGFGYDPILFHPAYGRTLADVTHEEKLRVSHRGTAFRRLSEWLRQSGTVLEKN